jgi:hypothetical protein
MVKQTTVTIAPWWVNAILSFIAVLLTRMLFEWGDQYAKGRKNIFARIGLKAALAMGILKFLWIAFLMYLGFIVFAKYNVSINIALALAAIPFIGPAEDLYKVITNSFSKKE